MKHPGTRYVAAASPHFNIGTPGPTREQCAYGAYERELWDRPFRAIVAPYWDALLPAGRFFASNT